MMLCSWFCVIMLFYISLLLIFQVGMVFWNLWQLTVTRLHSRKRCIRCNVGQMCGRRHLLLSTTCVFVYVYYARAFTFFARLLVHTKVKQSTVKVSGLHLITYFQQFLKLTSWDTSFGIVGMPLAMVFLFPMFPKSALHLARCSNGCTWHLSCQLKSDAVYLIYVMLLKLTSFLSKVDFQGSIDVPWCNI